MTPIFADEVFKQIPDFPNYQVSNYGRLYNSTSGKLLSNNSDIRNSTQKIKFQQIRFMVMIFYPEYFSDYDKNNTLVCVEYPSDKLISIIKIFRKSELLTESAVSELFYYKDGLLFYKYNVLWKGASFHKHTAAERLFSSGEMVVYINKYRYKSHRVIFQLHNPDIDISNYTVMHIDGVKCNNRIENLELSEQVRVVPSTTMRGVCSRSDGKFTAQITVNNKYYHLGVFDSEESAHIAYMDALIFHNREESKHTEIPK